LWRRGAAGPGYLSGGFPFCRHGEPHPRSPEDCSVTRLRRKEALQGLLSLIPIVAALLVFRAYPLLTGIEKSFTDWDGLFRSNWVGLKNYLYLLSGGDQFWKLIGNSVILLINVPLQLVIGLVVAVLLYEKTPGWRFFRSVFFIPQILSTIVIGYLFRFLFSYSGPINEVLRRLGADWLAIQWLGNRASALGVIILVLLWIDIGWQGILFLGGLSAIDASIFDAALIDGANYWQRTFRIVLPMTLRVVEYSVIMSVVWTFTGLFPIIYSVTGGGPGYETTTIDYMVYLKAFVISNRLGEACSLAMILMVVVGALTILQMRISDRLDDWG
jgi:multiple sugar transport system permease protein